MGVPLQYGNAALTNFAALTTEQKTVWSKEMWKVARNNSFINQFAGTGHNAMVQRITELTKSEKGARAVITLIADLEGDGVMGDFTLEGNEEQIKSYDQVIQLDQLRHANRLAGRMSDQKSVVNFRKSSRDVLGYWMADRLDQLAFLTLSGESYTLKTNGAARAVLGGGNTGRNFSELEFAADVSAPSANRYLRWDASAGTLDTGDTTAIAADDTLSYKALVELKAYAKENYVRGIKTGAGEEVYHVFVTPTGMARLKLDPDYLANVRSAGVRGGKNPLFAGTTSVMVDGLVIHEYRHVFNTKGMAGGSKWGAGGAIDGQAVLFCGAQALGMADIGDAEWVEKGFDYDNQHGISTGKICGLLKPKFHSNYSGTVEDFGVIRLDTAI
jgi:N4-gp56 family major capsid protein